MGFSYTSITLKGAEQAPVADYLRQLNREAYVSPTTNGITVVYDRESEDQDTVVLERLAAQLSEKFKASALAALVHDSDVLWYCLYTKGHRLDEYSSEPAYFLDTEPVPPSGGNAALLARAFEVEDRIDEIDAILRHWDDDNVDEYLTAEERHERLAEALSFPPYAHNAGYDSLAEGNGAEDMDRVRVVKTL